MEQYQILVIFTSNKATTAVAMETISFGSKELAEIGYSNLMGRPMPFGDTLIAMRLYK